eukprot:TRINITY_DN4640_c0_g1_i5.p3 TRINITY_DN4640_c0_g1~~TRINITY_DN4640_c0_g1_i5.p3  ORF type:complete len:120 (-),score=21.61 TRINITY_DN4640_c0_g1_i5:619-978(-)
MIEAGGFNQFEHNVRMEEKVEKREEFELFKKLEVFKNEGDEQLKETQLLNKEMEIGQEDNIKQLLQLISKGWALNLIQVFKTFDINYDGQLSFPEFSFGLSNCGFILTKKRLINVVSLL